MANDGSVQKGDVKIHIPGEEGAKEAAEAFECQWDLVPESEKDPEVDL